jgi:hypothetical protein
VRRGIMLYLLPRLEIVSTGGLLGRGTDSLSTTECG